MASPLTTSEHELARDRTEVHAATTSDSAQAKIEPSSGEAKRIVRFPLKSLFPLCKPLRLASCCLRSYSKPKKKKGV